MQTAAVAFLTFLTLTLPLRGSAASDELSTQILIATVVGTLIARRYEARGDRVERVLRRATLSALVASALLLVLVLVAAQARAGR